MESYAPIVVFVFRKLDPLKLMIESLRFNHLASQSDLIIFSDGWRNLNEKSQIFEVRKYIHAIQGFKSLKIIESNSNLGLAASIIKGVSEVIAKYGSAIVLEDDLILSRNFLSYINQGLNYYQDNKSILSICAYSPIIKGYHADIYFSQRSSSWGWATWADRWEEVDWDCKKFEKFNLFQIVKFNRMGSDLFGMLNKQMNGQINSWAVRFCFHQYNYKLYSVHPTISKVQNIGFGNLEATNTSKRVNRFNTILDNGEINNFEFISKPHLVRLVLRQFLRPFGFFERIKSLLLNG